MTDHITNRFEAPAEHNTMSDAGRQLQQQALALLEGKSRPTDSKQLALNTTPGSLPSLEITGGDRVAGKTYRRSNEGVTSDGGKILLS